MVGEGEAWNRESSYSVVDSKITEIVNKGDSFSRVLCEQDT